MPWASGRWLGRLDQVDADPARLDLGQQGAQTVGVEWLGEAVVDRLADQHVIGDGYGTGAGVLLTGGQGRPGRGQQVVGLHALQMDGTSLAPPRAGHHQRPVEIPPPPGGQHRVGQHGLGQDLGDRAAVQHGRHLAQREAVLWAEGEDDGVVVGRRLQLEIEGDTEPLAQGQPEGPVDAPAVGRVDDELGSFALVEDPLDDQAIPGGESAQGGQTRPQVGDHLGGHLFGHAGRPAHDRTGAVAVPAARSGSSSARSAPTSADSSAVRAGASPNQKGMVGGRSPASWTRTVPVSTFTTRHEWVPSRKMSPGGGLDGEVLVHRSDGHAVGVEDDPVVAGLGDGSSAGQGGQPGAPPGTEPAVDGVMVEMGAPPAASGRDAPRDHVDHLVERLLGPGRRRGRRRRTRS